MARDLVFARGARRRGAAVRADPALRPGGPGHGVPEVMVAVAENGGRIRPPVTVVKALASAICIGYRRLGRPRGPDRPDRVGLCLEPGPVRADVGDPAADHRRLRGCWWDRRNVQRAAHRPVLRLRDHPAGVLPRRSVRHHLVGRHCRPRQPGLLRLGAVLSQRPPRSLGRHDADYLLVAVLGLAAGLVGVGFKTFLYKLEDIVDSSGTGVRSGPGPAVGGVRSVGYCSLSPRCTASATR